MQEEVATILAPTGLRFDWKALDGHDDASVSVELAVATFKGTCQVSESPPKFSELARLGWTHISDGEVLPFTDVDCDRIGAFVQRGLQHLQPDLREEALGRAIARVLTHELYHILARTAHHSSEGIDQEAYSERILLDEKFEIEAHEQILRPSSSVMGQGEILPLMAHGSPKLGQSVYIKSGCSSCHGTYAEGTKRGPVLRVKQLLNSVILAARLAKDGPKMFQRARRLKVARPSLAEEEIDDLVSFLNATKD